MERRGKSLFSQARFQESTRAIWGKRDPRSTERQQIRVEIEQTRCLRVFGQSFRSYSHFAKWIEGVNEMGSLKVIIEEVILEKEKCVNKSETLKCKGTLKEYTAN